jgi:hypothetical protein
VIRSGWGSTLPRRLMLVAAAALIPVIAGCEAGGNAPTLQFHYPTDAAGATVGQLSIRNVFVLGAPLGSRLRPGQSASVFLALVTSGSDTLTSITAPGRATSVTLPAGGVKVSYLHPALLTGPKPEVYLTGLTKTITNGSNITLVLHFRNAGPVTLKVPVMARASHYVTYGIPPSPAPSTTPARRPGFRPSPTPTGGVTAPVSPTPSVSPTP